MDNIRRYGAATWYDWRLKNWGVKWNAGDIRRSKKDNRVRFETPDGGVENLINKLAQKFPTVTIEYTIQYGDYHDKYVLFEYKGQAMRIKEES